MAGRQPAETDALALWFNQPGEANTSRRALTRERVVAEGLTVIAAVGAQALSMRALAARLGVVPGALYRHVRNKEQLYDLILDAVLAEVDCHVDPGQPWTAQIATLAHRLRSVLEDHPGVAALLKIRDPLSPASLALAEAFLAPLLAAGLPGRDAAAAFRLDLRLHPRLRRRRSHVARRTAPPRRRDQRTTAGVPAGPARQPLPRPRRPRHPRLVSRPRRALRVRPRYPPART